MIARRYRDVMAGVVTIIFSLPLYLALVNVFKFEEQITRFPVALPNPFTLENLSTVISRPDNLLFEGLKTSFIITVSTVIIVTFFASTLGYYIARNQRSRLLQALLLVFIAGMMVPTQVTIVPVARLLNWFGLMGTLQGMILFQAGGGLLSFAVFVYSGFVKTIPRELDESAMIDGASKFTLFWRIIFPLMRPATATVAIFLTLWTWNEFLIPLIILGPGKGITITTGIYTAVDNLNINYGGAFALMFLSALPILAFFFALQKEFIAGLTGGSLKG
jgi:raffinose/stachyose/melibiose transport system permease protein